MLAMDPTAVNPPGPAAAAWMAATFRHMPPARAATNGDRMAMSRVPAPTKRDQDAMRRIIARIRLGLGHLALRPAEHGKAGAGSEATRSRTAVCPTMW